MSARRKVPAPGTAIAVIALVFAMGGAAVAATQIGPKRIKANAIRTVKIKDGAVTSAKLAPGERSLAFSTNQSGTIAVNPDAASFGDADRIAQLTLPEGSYVVQAHATFGPSSGVERIIACVLRDDGSIVTRGDTHTAGIATFSAEVSLAGVVTGGTVDMACQANGGTNARNRVLIATQVGTVITQ